MSDLRGGEPGGKAIKADSSIGERVLYVVPPDAILTSEIDTIDLATLFRELKDRWRLIAAITLASAALAVAIALLISPVYRASALLSTVEHNQTAGMRVASITAQLGGLAGLAGLSTDGGAGVATTIATLKSRQFQIRFVDEMNLKPVLFPDRWNAKSGQWIVGQPGLFDTVKSWLLPEQGASNPSESLAPGEPTDNETYTLLSEDVIGVEQDASTSLITLNVDWTSPVEAANWANRLVAMANQELRSRSIADAERSIAYLTQQANMTDKQELRTSLFDLIEDQMKIMAVAKTQEDYALRVIDPATAPDLTERLRPRRGLIVALGIVIGAFVGVLATLLAAGMRKSRPTNGGN